MKSLLNKGLSEFFSKNLNFILGKSNGKYKIFIIYKKINFALEFLLKNPTFLYILKI